MWMPHPRGSFTPQGGVSFRFVCGSKRPHFHPAGTGTKFYSSPQTCVILSEVSCSLIASDVVEGPRTMQIRLILVAEGSIEFATLIWLLLIV
jgi:hypothetical protein